ncbi:nitrite reductase small subunit NirD [Halomonas sp. PAMB 3232]|uniref:nitrite reductase small subunit NirD n=1 Tax=Halomonas sp. PAMB 3232 TaxID=3075221 RepID=UPI0028964670|nr:nitrite reductase small subunit NirD [Halomonas sp. PAMB 3232]WNL38165.1 nitrite reductase small subunit NirD [Halomonas sp. PAMB 3232]
MTPAALTLNDVSATAWQPLCQRADLVAFSGVVAWIDAPQGEPCQIALFYLPGQMPELYALDHFDPFSNAFVIGRGIVGDIDAEPVIASPLYKQHFRLSDGQCLEDESVRLRTWPVRLEGEQVWIEA